MRLATFAFVLSATAALAVEPPAAPPEFTPPPAVATDGFVPVQLATTIPMSVTELRAFMVQNPIIDYLEPTGDLSPPANLEILSGTWPEAGTVRRVQLEDGHYVIERILHNRPESFKYQLWVFTNAAGQGVEQIVAEQRFIAEGPNQTRFEWDYNLVPRSFITRPFVRRAAPNIQTYLGNAMEGLARDAIAAATQ